MAGLDLATAQAHLDQWIAADLAVATGQSYTIGGRSLTRANAAEIRKNIDYWNRWVQRLSNGSGMTVRLVVPND
jgi:hypothetical protein